MITTQLAAEHVTTAVLAAGGTWDNLIYGMFHSWKGWAAAGSVMILGTVGLLMLGSRRFAGLAMIFLGFILAAVFLNAEHFVDISNNQVHEWQQTPSNNNVFNRGS